MINVQVWSGSGSVRITDMTNAGKRGKTCKILSIRGEGSRWIEPEQVVQKKAMDYTQEIILTAEVFPTDTKFEDVTKEIEVIAHKAWADGVIPVWLEMELREIRGVDAPKQKLIYENENFSACADDDGITINDKCDLHNEPSMITSHLQAKNAAYAVAVKAWTKVTQAKTFSEAGNVLRDAGARLHYYCRMD